MVAWHRLIRSNAQDINTDLAALFKPLEEQRTSYVKVARRNFVAVFTRPAYVRGIERLLDELCPLYPCRFFLVQLDKRARDLDVRISARCFRVSKDMLACTEIVHLVVPPCLLETVPSILRAHFLPGMPAEMLLYGMQSGTVLRLESLICLVDRVILDSAEQNAELGDVQALCAGGAVVVDLEWVRLGMWRKQLSSVFDLKSVQDCLPSLSALDIQYGVKTLGSESLPANVLLLAGWLIHSLRWSVVAVARDHYECIASDGRTAEVRVGIVSDSALSTPKLLSCRLDFTDGQDNTGLADAELGSPGASPYIQLSSNGQLQTEFSMGTAVNSMVSNSTGSNSRESHSLVSCMSAPLGPQTAVECIKHCFLFGDGVKSYNNALDSAIELSDLGRGYLAGSCRAGSCRAGDSRTAGRFSPE